MRCPYVKAARNKGGLPVFICNFNGSCRWYDDSIKTGDTCHAYSFQALKNVSGRWQVKDENGKIPIRSRASGPKPRLTINDLKVQLARETFGSAALNRAALLARKHSFDLAVGHLADQVKGSWGSTGPAAPRIECAGGKIRAWLPESKWAAPPDVVLTGTALAKLALTEHDIVDRAPGQLLLL